MLASTKVSTDDTLIEYALQAKMAKQRKMKREHAMWIMDLSVTNHDSTCPHHPQHPKISNAKNGDDRCQKMLQVKGVGTIRAAWEFPASTITCCITHILGKTPPSRHAH